MTSILTKRTTIASIKSAVFAAGVLSIVLMPTIAFASQGALEITEIMYDAPGSDTGREWLEVANTGTTTVDLLGYKIFEGGVNHGISIVSGTSTLAVGEVAVVSNDPQKFFADFPHYTGTLLKSSFSLLNAGETLALKDGKLTTLTSATYRSSMGAAGDGNSLHKNLNRWTSGAPNPGSLAAIAALAPPPVEAPAVGTPKAAVAKSSTSKQRAPISASSVSQSVAVGASALPQDLPSSQNNILWTGLGLAALVIVGVGGALYVRSPKALPLADETLPRAEEFDIS